MFPNLKRVQHVLRAERAEAIIVPQLESGTLIVGEHTKVTAGSGVKIERLIKP